MTRLATNYTITWSSNTFTITYASTYGTTIFSSADYVFSAVDSTYFYFGSDNDSLTLLDYSKCTSPAAASVAALSTAVAALVTVYSAVSASIIPSLTTTYNLGSSAKRWNLFYVGQIDATSAITTTGDVFAPAIHFGSGGNGLACRFPDVAATSNIYDSAVYFPDPGSAITITMPSTTTTLVGTDTTNTLTNKTYSGGTFSPPETTASVTFSFSGAGSAGSTSSSAVTIRFVKFGNFVTLFVPALTGTNGGGGTSAFTVSAGAPAGFRPTNKQYMDATLSANGSWQTNPILTVDSSGNLTFCLDSSENNVPASNVLVVRSKTYRYYLD